MHSRLLINVAAVWEANAAGKCRWVCRYAGMTGTASLHPQLAASRLADRLGVRHSRVHAQGRSRCCTNSPWVHFFNISGVAV